METTNTDFKAATGVIKRVTGPLVRATGMSEAKLYEVVRVSDEKLMGEIIELHGDEAPFRYTRKLPVLHLATRCTERVELCRLLWHPDFWSRSTTVCNGH